MSEPTPTPSGPNDAQLGAVTEQELDNLLSRASTLAADASQQVGVPESPPGAPLPPSPAELSATLDDELSRLDGLVTSAASEVGAESASVNMDSQPGVDAAPRAADSTGAAATRGVPDFMMEFTAPASEAPSKGSTSTEAPPARTPSPASTARRAPEPAPAGGPPDPKSAHSGAPTATSAPPASPLTATAKSGIVGTGMLGVVSTTKPQSETAAVNGTTAEVGNEGAGTGSGSSKGGLAKLMSLALGIVVRVLDVVDRPFARLGDGLKDIIGWIALATLGTALVVYMIHVI